MRGPPGIVESEVSGAQLPLRAGCGQGPIALLDDALVTGYEQAEPAKGIPRKVLVLKRQANGEPSPVPAAKRPRRQEDRRVRLLQVRRDRPARRFVRINGEVNRIARLTEVGGRLGPFHYALAHG